MILVAEDRVDPSALIKMGSHHPIGQISLTFLRQQVASLKTGYCGAFLTVKCVQPTQVANCVTLFKTNEGDFCN